MLIALLIWRVAQRMWPVWRRRSTRRLRLGSSSKPRTAMCWVPGVRIRERNCDATAAPHLRRNADRAAVLDPRSFASSPRVDQLRQMSRQLERVRPDDAELHLRGSRADGPGLEFSA